MAPLPIPKVLKTSLSFVYVKYNIDEEPNNLSLRIRILDTERIADLRREIEETYGFDQSSYLMAWVNKYGKRVKELFNTQ